MLKNNQTLYFTVCINYALMLNKSTLSNLITNPSQFQQLNVSLTVSGSCSWSASGPAGGQLSQKRIIYSSVLLSVTLLRVAALPAIPSRFTVPLSSFYGTLSHLSISTCLSCSLQTRDLLPVVTMHLRTSPPC